MPVPRAKLSQSRRLGVEQARRRDDQRIVVAAAAAVVGAARVHLVAGKQAAVDGLHFAHAANTKHGSFVQPVCRFNARRRQAGLTPRRPQRRSRIRSTLPMFQKMAGRLTPQALRRWPPCLLACSRSPASRPSRSPRALVCENSLCLFFEKFSILLSICPHFFSVFGSEIFMFVLVATILTANVFVHQTCPRCAPAMCRTRSTRPSCMVIGSRWRLLTLVRRAPRAKCSISRRARNRSDVRIVRIIHSIYTIPHACMRSPADPSVHNFDASS
jgi:hypothetical protein